MNNPLSPDEINKILKENKSLKRRLERMEKEMKNLVALNERAMRLREYSEREKRLQSEYNILLLENAPDLIFILDTGMRLRMCTKTVVHFLGHEEMGTLIGTTFDDAFSSVMPRVWIESTREILETLMSRGEHIQYNDVVSLEHGRKVFSISAATAIDADGDTTGIICLMHDSTEMMDMKDAAEAATRAKSSFLASMSHEIRTPMNAIKGFSELILRTELSNQQRLYSENILNATTSLLTIINDILDFSKIEANRYEILDAPYDTATEIRELCNLMHPKAEEKGIYFAAYIDPSIPSILFGDNLRIRQILMNVINNAIKFTQTGGILLSISSQTDENGELLMRYSVKDTGQGIKKEELPKIFQAFEQADFYKNRNISGTGLGLAISKNLAKLMRGEIYAESEYGVGSEFFINIPQKDISGKIIAPIDRDGKNVLVYYSNEALPPLWKRTFDSLGFEYRFLSDKKQFLESLSQNSVTHVIVDGDFELAKKVQRENAGIKIGFLHGVSSMTDDIPDNIRILHRPLLSFDVSDLVSGRKAEYASSEQNPEDMKSISYEKSRVLIVDDNEINLFVASEILGTYDIVSDTAVSGYEALDMLKEKEYDIIFMDHMMPGIDGVETTATIRSWDIKQPAIIALTANAIGGIEEFYISQGFDGYVTKPIDLDSLDAVLSKFLNI